MRLVEHSALFALFAAVGCALWFGIGRADGAGVFFAAAFVELLFLVPTLVSKGARAIRAQET